MNWTITTEIIGKGDRDASVKVTATKDGTTIDRTFTGVTSHEGLKSAVKSWLQNYENIQSVEAGTIDLTEPIPEVVEPTQAELDKADWDKDRERLRVLMELVRDGVVPSNDTRVTALQTKVRSGFKPAYLG
jgi:hypothetical protein